MQESYKVAEEQELIAEVRRPAVVAVRAAEHHAQQRRKRKRNNDDNDGDDADDEGDSDSDDADSDNADSDDADSDDADDDDEDEEPRYTVEALPPERARGNNLHMARQRLLQLLQGCTVPVRDIAQLIMGYALTARSVSTPSGGVAIVETESGGVIEPEFDTELVKAFHDPVRVGMNCFIYGVASDLAWAVFRSAVPTAMQPAPTWYHELWKVRNANTDTMVPPTETMPVLLGVQQCYDVIARDKRAHRLIRVRVPPTDDPTVVISVAIVFTDCDSVVH